MWRLRSLASRTAVVVGAPLTAAAVADRVAGPVSDLDLPREYDAHAIASAWAQRPVQFAARGAVIVGEVVPFATRLAADAYASRLDTPDAQSARARELREMLVRLGPAFIKLGQALSIRPDLLPACALFELQRLCDDCPPFDDALARQIVRAELGAPFDALYDCSEHGTAPVAAASLGQVYRARLRATGEEVAVKVQRPDMRAAISADLLALRALSIATDALTRALTQQQPYHAELCQAFSAATWGELDYEREADNQNRFRRMFGDLRHADTREARAGAERADADGPGGARAPHPSSSVGERCVAWLVRALSAARACIDGSDSGARVYVPRVHAELTSRRVLTTEWVEGEQLARSAPHVIARLVPVGVACFLEQLLKHGFFHCDPHPGNLLVTTDGRLALIDFGLCAELPAPDTGRLASAIVGAVHADAARVVEDAVRLGFLPADVDRACLAPLLERVLRGGGRGEPGDDGAPADYAAVQRRRRHLRQISDDLNEIFFHYPFRVPEYFALITRALLVLEGIALKGDPQFDILQSAFPWVARHFADSAILVGRASHGGGVA